MAKPVLINATATTNETSISRVGYGIKLLSNDATTGNLLIAFDKSTTNADGDYIMLQPGETIENYDACSWGTIYFKSSTGSVSFRLYSQSL